jgi:hypothetical protein
LRCEIAGRRIHGTTRCIPLEVFEAERRQQVTIQTRLNQAGFEEECALEHFDWTAGQCATDYVAAVRQLFLDLGCTSRRFGTSEETQAKSLEKRGVPLDIVRDAMIMGASTNSYLVEIGVDLVEKKMQSPHIQYAWLERLIHGGAFIR